MSLNLLRPPAVVADMMTAWPDKPSVHQIPDSSPLTRLISAETLLDYLGTGCVPPGDINIIKNAAARHPAGFTTAGRLDPARVEHWRSNGYTVQMRHVERWHPPVAVLMWHIKSETGCAGYASAFVTPPGEQGLEWHWDQYLGIVVQLAGTKRWDLWRPVAEDPTGEHETSITRWQPEWPDQWKASGPDLTFDLTPGQALVLPRGWVHNAYSPADATELSVHVTVVLQERTPHWLAQQMVQGTIGTASFRRVIPPCDIRGETLLASLEIVRGNLVDHLNGLDLSDLAEVVRERAMVEPESTT